MKTFCAKGSGQCSCAKFHDDPNNCERGVPIMKTSTLTGTDLNAAVAMALGQDVTSLGDRRVAWHRVTSCSKPGCAVVHKQGKEIPDYATDIALAWPIIKEYDISLRKCGITLWMAEIDLNEGDAMVCQATDHDPQVAAMRAFVESVFGDTVELP